MCDRLPRLLGKHNLVRLRSAVKLILGLQSTYAKAYYRGTNYHPYPDPYCAQASEW